ncbi:MAG: TonB-dependent receptor plug domain-containing protein [Algibacter sp.]
MKIRIFFLLSFFSLSFYSQNNNRIPLLEYINSIEKNNTVTFSYDPQLLQKVTVIPLEDQSLKPILKYLSKETAFNFKLLDNGTVLVSPYVANTNFRLCLTIIDSEFNTPIIGATVSNENDKLVFIYEGESFVKYVNINNWKTIHIKYPGYKEQIISTNKLAICKSITLSPVEITLDNVFINYLTSGIKYNSDNQSIEIKVKDAGLLPGETETDIFNSIETLPGINSSNGKAGSLAFRGDDPDKTLVYYDNIPIYHNGHYFGTFSPYNADLLKTISVKHSGYSAINGGSISGLIELNTSDKIADSTSYSIGTATSFYLASANIPIIKDKWSIQVGTRSSYPFDVETSKIKAVEDFIFQESLISRANAQSKLNLETFDFKFADYNLKSNFQLNKNNKLKFSSLYITNTLDIVARQVIETQPRPGEPPPTPLNTLVTANINLENIGFSLAHDVKWNSAISTSSFVTYSKFSQSFYNENAPPGRRILTSNSYDNVVNNLSFKSTTTTKFKNKNILNVGLEAINYDVSGDRTIISPMGKLTEGVNPSSANLFSLYSDFLLKNTQPFTFKFGLRTSYYSLKEKNIYIEPRMLVNFKFDNNITLKASLGDYNQFLNNISGRKSIGSGVEQFNWTLSNNNNIPVVNGRQGMIGGFYKKNNWLIDVESYYKKTDNIATYDLYDITNTNFYFIGNYTTYGADFLVRKSCKNIDAWVSYSLIKTLAQFDDIQEDSFRSIWDQTHQLNAVFSYSYKKLKVSTGWKYKSGLKSLEDIRHFYLNGPPINQVNPLNLTYSDNGDIQYDQYPDQHQLDISLSYNFIPKHHKWNTVIGLAATNLYNQKNLSGQDRMANSRSQYDLSNRYNIGFSPSMLIKFNFF